MSSEEEPEVPESCSVLSDRAAAEGTETFLHVAATEAWCGASLQQSLHHRGFLDILVCV